MEKSDLKQIRLAILGLCVAQEALQIAAENHPDLGDTLNDMNRQLQQLVALIPPWENIIG